MTSTNTKIFKATCLFLAMLCPVAHAEEAATEAQNESASGTGTATSATDAAELAKKLSNPVADLISVPIQYTWTTGIGPAEADQNRLIVQPVIPVHISEDWNLVIRTIMPLYIDQQAPVAGGQDVSGTGDVLQSFFFSPKEPTKNGWVWGVGPVLNWATASDTELGSGKWSAGPTALALHQKDGTTYGILANQLWSFAGSGNQADVNATYLQPFLAHTTKKFTTFSINTQSTYDWESSEWSIPIFLQVAQLVKIAHKPVQFQLGYFNYVDTPQYGPDWGIQFTVTLLYPKK